MSEIHNPQSEIHNPSWLQVTATFPTPPLDFSPFVELYRDCGIENTSETELSLTGCLPSVPSSQRVARDLKERLLAAGAGQVEVSELPEQNWDEVWRRFFKPRRVGKRFVVKPTWEEFEAKPEDILLELDPGQAFGTGDHPTTRMCLELLEDLDLEGQGVLDIGCGSGILSIACAKLGGEVSACDIDPIAVEVTRLNAARNGVEFETWVEIGMGTAEGPVAQDESDLHVNGGRPSGSDVCPLPALSLEGRGFPEFNLVVSNIISATLIRMSHQVAGLLQPGGGWIVSGIIEENWPDVRAAAERADFILAAELHEDGWVAARFHRLEVED